MSYLALYRKYRPSSFQDLIGQTEVANIIRNEILNNRISHAYLFSGPRGTGKTSTAKIIAKMINCFNLSEDGVPCEQCDSCLNFSNSSDVVEIDAASNNGVDEIRELRDKVNLVPTYGKYKIYIIDEVHMLTTQAFNALLKTLEEPPAHVIFILATTEFYKIPVTVVSRCQKFQFLKFSNEDIVKRLKNIAEKESISVNDDVLFEISRLSDGGLRDAINMLDQLSSLKNDDLQIQDVYNLNGVISYGEFRQLLENISKNQVVKIVEFVDNMDKYGKSFEHFISDFISFLKDILVYKNTSSFSSNIQEKNDALVALVDVFSEEQLYNFILSLNDLTVRIKTSSFGKILLITEFIRISNNFSKKDVSFSSNGLLSEKVLKSKNNLQSNDDNAIMNKQINQKINFKDTVKITDELKKIRINNAFATASKLEKEKFISNWKDVLERLSNDTKYLAIAGMMNDVEVLVVGSCNVIFLAQYDSLLERLFSQLEVIEQLLSEVFHQKYKVIFLLKEEWCCEKEKYIANLKAGKKYNYINEDTNIVSEKENFDCDSDFDKIVSILGNDIISYE